ncbi:hypothetical protein ACFVRU_26405 [Streptomyces sp. NPDC057927]
MPLVMRFSPAAEGALIIAIDPAAFGAADAFTAAVDATLGELKGLAAADGAEGGVPPR